VKFYPGTSGSSLAFGDFASLLPHWFSNLCGNRYVLFREAKKSPPTPRLRRVNQLKLSAGQLSKFNVEILRVMCISRFHVKIISFGFGATDHTRCDDRIFS
jgi:hypothetical protein